MHKIAKPFLAVALALVLTVPAHAGHYVMTSQSGGNCTYFGANFAYSNPPSGFTTGGWGYGSFGYSGHGAVGLTCQGTITTNYSWVPDYASDIAPQCVVVVETCQAQWGGVMATSTHIAPTGSCDNGLGQTEVDSQIIGTVTSSYSGVSTSTRYKIISGGNSLSIPCTPKVSVTAYGGRVSGSVQYVVNVAPVVINLAGSTFDSLGNPAAMIGQGITASLYAGGSVTLSNFQWTVPGDVFWDIQNSTNGADPELGFGGPEFLDPRTWQQAAPHWYWYSNNQNWGSDTPFTVSVTATATSPTGVQLGTVTAQKMIDLWAPQGTLRSSSPQNSSYESDGGGITSSPGISSESHGQINGMEFTVAAPTPAGFFATPPTKLYDWGSLSDIQLVDREWEWTGSGLSNIENTDGEYWLDNVCPFGSNGLAAPGAYLSFTDVPSIGFGIWTSINGFDQFKTYILYTPPSGDATAVPVFLVNWSWVAGATYDGSKWQPAIPGRTAITNAQPSSELPAWNETYINN